MSCYYVIIPEGTYEIIRNCGKCGVKTNYHSTGKFRVNANGNRLDVWLIYQCEKCKHTYNLPIYERVSPKSIDREEYAAFLRNDEELAFQMANDRELLEKHHCVIQTEGVAYSLDQVEAGDDTTIVIQNPYGMKVRIEKLISRIWQISRSKAKKLLEDEELSYFVDEKQDIVIHCKKEVSSSVKATKLLMENRACVRKG